MQFLKNETNENAIGNDNQCTTALFQFLKNTYLETAQRPSMLSGIVPSDDTMVIIAHPVPHVGNFRKTCSPPYPGGARTSPGIVGIFQQTKNGTTLTHLTAYTVDPFI